MMNTIYFNILNFKISVMGKISWVSAVTIFVGELLVGILLLSNSWNSGGELLDFTLIYFFYFLNFLTECRCQSDVCGSKVWRASCLSSQQVRENNPTQDDTSDLPHIYFPTFYIWILKTKYELRNLYFKYQIAKLKLEIIRNDSFFCKNKNWRRWIDFSSV